MCAYLTGEKNGCVSVMCKDVIFVITFVFKGVVSGSEGVLQCIHGYTQYILGLGTFKGKLAYLYNLSWKTGLLGEKISKCSLGTSRVLNNMFNKGYV